MRRDQNAGYRVDRNCLMGKFVVPIPRDSVAAVESRDVEQVASSSAGLLDSRKSSSGFRRVRSAEVKARWGSMAQQKQESTTSWLVQTFKDYSVRSTEYSVHDLG